MAKTSLDDTDAPLDCAALASVLGSEPDIAPEDAWDIARELLLTDPRLAVTATALRRLTEAAGLSAGPLGAYLAFQAREQLEHLLSQEWEHPGEVIELFDEAEDNLAVLEPLVALASRRLADEPASERLPRVVERLRTVLAGFRLAAERRRRDRRSAECSRRPDKEQ